MVSEAEACGATADMEEFVSFVVDHLPPDYLDTLVEDMSASLEEIWEGMTVVISVFLRSILL